MATRLFVLCKYLDKTHVKCYYCNIYGRIQDSKGMSIDKTCNITSNNMHSIKFLCTEDNKLFVQTFEQLPGGKICINLYKI